MKKSLLLITTILCLGAGQVSAQQVGIKTNAAYWATTTPNIGVEVAINPKLTFDLSGAYNPWTFGAKEENKKLQHWLVRPEIRFWPYEKWDGHFLGINAMFASYNASGVDIPLFPLNSLKNSRFEGYAVGAGLSYGYQFYLGLNWNLELSASLGYLYFNYDRYECRKCGKFLNHSHKHWFGPTNVGLTFIYLFKSKKY